MTSHFYCRRSSKLWLSLTGNGSVLFLVDALLNRLTMLRCTIKYFVVALVYTYCAEARKTRVTWVNGIAHSMEHMIEGQEYISKLFADRPVVFCHNPTGMSSEEDFLGYLGDLTQAGTQKLGRITVEVELLVKHLRQALEDVGPNGMIVHIAHSQGALITSLAARQLSAREMNQIEVLCFGGAAAIRRTPQTPFHRCVNYYSVNDPLLFIVPSASQALRSGFVGDEEFCFLAPRAGDPIIDHSLIGPTYSQALEWEGIRFQQKYVPLPYRTSRYLQLKTSSYFALLEQRFGHLLKALLRPILLWCIFTYKVTHAASSKIHHSALKPLAELLYLVGTALRDLIRLWRRDDKYVPVLHDKSQLEVADET